MILYIIGLVMTGIAVSSLEGYGSVQGFLVIGGGLMLIGIATMLLTYLNGGRKDDG